MPIFAKLKPELIAKLSAVIPDDKINTLDQSQIYLLAIPEICHLLINNHIKLTDLKIDRDLCFYRLQLYLAAPEILTLFIAKKLTLSTLSAISDIVYNLLISKFDDLIADPGVDKITQVIMDNTHPIPQRAHLVPCSISPWNDSWITFKEQYPEVRISSDAQLEFCEAAPATTALSTPLVESLAPRVARSRQLAAAIATPLAAPLASQIAEPLETAISTPLVTLSASQIIAPSHQSAAATDTEDLLPMTSGFDTSPTTDSCSDLPPPFILPPWMTEADLNTNLTYDDINTRFRKGSQLFVPDRFSTIGRVLKYSKISITLPDDHKAENEGILYGAAKLRLVTYIIVESHTLSPVEEF